MILEEKMWDTVDANMAIYYPNQHPHLTNLSSTTGRDQERAAYDVRCLSCAFLIKILARNTQSMGYRKGFDVIKDIRLAAKGRGSG